MHKYTVMKNCASCKRLQYSLIVKTGSGPNYVIGLPFTGFAACISQRNCLLIEAAYLAIYISGIIIII